jgi:hypothetical protein
MGLKPIKGIQANGMDPELTNGLWTALLLYLDTLREAPSRRLHEYENVLRHHLWLDFFKWPLDQLPYEEVGPGSPFPRFWRLIRDWYFDGKRQWHERYDFLEAIGRVRLTEKCTEYFVQRVNGTLERENSGFRFTQGCFAPVTNAAELAAIQVAAKPPTTALNPVGIHLQQALELLSDKANPDYRNSMKESISAVEVLCRLRAASCVCLLVVAGSMGRGRGAFLHCPTSFSPPTACSRYYASTINYYPSYHACLALIVNIWPLPHSTSAIPIKG